MVEDELLVLAGVVVAGVAGQWMAWRFRLPSILVLLGIGLLAGPVAGFLDPDETFGELLLPGVSLAVAVILFEGGLSLGWRDLRAAGTAVRNLITVGAAVTAVITAVVAQALLDVSWGVVAVLAAILVVTGPTVIGPLLRHVRPVGRVGAILRAEGILIDPLGAMAAVLVFEAVFAVELQEAPWAVAGGILRTLVLGGIVGAAGAAVLVLALARFWIPDLLHNAVTLALVLAVFVAGNVLQEESGLLSVTVMGLALASQRRVEVHHVLEFNETLSLLLISSLFILLAARMNADSFGEVAVEALVLTAVLVVVARPVAVLLSTLRSGLTFRERLFVAWLAPRGIVAAAVSSIFALRLQAEGIEGGAVLVPVTFTVIIGTIAVYAATARHVATRLGVAEPDPQAVIILGAHSWSRSIAEVLESHGVDVTLVDADRGNVATARMAGLGTYYGSILSDHALENIELGRVGHFLALSSSHEVNTLAVQRLRPVLDRRHVYQLAAPAGPARTSVPTRLGGRLLFGEGATYDDLSEDFELGAAVKATHLGEQYAYEQFTADNPDARLLFAIRGGRVQVATADGRLEPGPGDTIVTMLKPPSDSARHGTEASGAPGSDKRRSA